MDELQKNKDIMEAITVLVFVTGSSNSIADISPMGSRGTTYLLFMGRSSINIPFYIVDCVLHLVVWFYEY